MFLLNHLLVRLLLQHSLISRSSGNNPISISQHAPSTCRNNIFEVLYLVFKVYPCAESAKQLLGPFVLEPFLNSEVG
jgi:hypothetical protein